LGLPGDNKEEENIRKRSAKYREAAGKFLVEVGSSRLSKLSPT
jgi:hypothetical protein